MTSVKWIIRYALGLALLLAGCQSELAGPPHNETPWVAAPLKRIAHAGGGFQEQTYTNSLDALNANSPYFELFELDFSWTSDDQLVGIHDWDISLKSNFDLVLDEPPTLSEFEEMVKNNEKYQNFTIDTLIRWLELNPTKKIVTDVKQENVKALELLSKAYPDFDRRIIPQIYQPSEYQPVRDLGYDSIIWTLYAYGGENYQVLSHVEEMDLFAVTMPQDRATTGLANELLGVGVRSYVHTINTQEEFETFRQLGISEIYTDWLK